MVKISKTIDNALHLLRVLGQTGSATAVELSRLTGLSRTIVYRSLITLEKHGFTRRAGSKYSLGLSILQLADLIETDIRAAARSGLEDLATRYNATSILVVADGTEGVLLDEFVGHAGPTRIRYSLGFRSSLAVGGHGRTILAFSPPGVVEATLAKIEDERAVRQLRKTLDEIRAQGCAFSSDEVRSGVAGMAAPVLDRHDVAVASVGVVTVAGQFPDQQDVARSLKKVTAEIAARLVG